MNDIPYLSGPSYPLSLPGREHRVQPEESPAFADSFQSIFAAADKPEGTMPSSAKITSPPTNEKPDASHSSASEKQGGSGCIHPPHAMEEVSLLCSLDPPMPGSLDGAYDPGTHGEIFTAGVKESSAWGPEILPVPDTRQSTEYSCGASALQAVLMYYGEEFGENELMDKLKTTYNGTNPRDITRVARELGFQAELRENCTLEDLEKSIKLKVPVIVSGQAWREGDDLKKPWKDVWDSGHYMVIVGLDEKNVYFEDPSLLGSKGFMPREEFLDRWHDVDEKKYLQLGIFITGKKPAPPPPFMHIE